MGVAKRQSAAVVAAAVRDGLTDVGENYLQEARAKLPLLPPVRKHFIGHVQINKAKAIAALFDVVQSVDRIEAGRALSAAALADGKRLPVLLQVNISAVERFGCRPEDADRLAEDLRAELGLRLAGVMAIGPATADRDEISRAFDLAAKTFARVGGNTLSIGMSGDWREAVRAGSTMVRIGTALFGGRDTRVSMFSKIGSFFSIRDDDEESYEEELAAIHGWFRCPHAGRRGGTEVSVFSPRSYQDVVEIADSLRNRQVVIVNLQNADRALLQRVVDFTSGVAYTIDGKIQKLAEAIYLVAPAGVVVNAAGLRESMMADGTLDFMSNRVCE